MSAQVRPVFPFKRPAELDGDSATHPVLIAGGGPVGLTTALELAKRGVPSVVLEADATVAEGSRAVCFSRRTLEIIDGLGAATAVMDHGLPWVHGTSYYQDREVYRLSMPHGENEKFYPMVNLQQYTLEEILIDLVNRHPLIDLRWQSKVTGITQDEQIVSVAVETPQGTYDIKGDWLVAADGARSTIRKQLGLSLKGQSYEGRYLIADIHMESDYPTERRAWFDPPSNPGATILMHKQPGNIWRIDYQLRDDDDEIAELDPKRITDRITEHLDFIEERAAWTLEWSSLYKAHCLCLDDYRHGRCFFAGDAAHLVPIFGVRGLNSGIADANNIGWKLAAIIKGVAPDALLDSYSPERRAATLDIFDQAGKSTIFMTPPSRGYEILRQAALELAVDQAFTRPLINPRQSTPYFYATPEDADDPEFTAGPRPGDLFTNRHLPTGGFLSDKLGPGFTLLLFGGVMPPDLPNLPDLTTITLSDPQSRVLYDAEKDSGYLLRPDGHVAARRKHLPKTTAAIDDYIRHAIERAIFKGIEK